MHRKIPFIAAWLMAVLCLAQATDVPLDLKNRLHAASKDLVQHTDREAVIQSLYEQIRPRVAITDKSLPVTKVDRIVRAYVSEKYAPALIGNYASLYAKLLAAKGEFSTDNDLHPFDFSDDLIAVLCMTARGRDVQVDYRTSAASPDAGWITSATFVFSSQSESLTLSRIELPFKGDVKVHVDGI